MAADQELQLQRLREKLKEAIQEYELTTDMLVQKIVLVREERRGELMLKQVEVTSGSPGHLF